MKNLKIFFTGLFTVVMALSLTAVNAQTKFENELKALKNVVSVTKIDNGPFAEKYEVMIKQPVSHDNPSLGTFNQRFIVSHVGYDRPVVMVTEGYRGEYGMNPNYREEISKEFDTNMVFVEHRYFSKSTPTPRNWEHLTVWNAVNDLHVINETMKNLYKGKWISTGISKGGQTTIMYRTYFPEDVNISVPYVAPICFDVEDGRHEFFIANVCGTPEERKIVEDFQNEFLKRRTQLMPMFEALCKEKGFKFYVSLDEIYDLCALEYSFALWQWGTSVSKIPALTASDKEIFDAMMSVSGPDYFAINDEPSFNIQAARELGYYGYDVIPFAKNLSVKSTKGYLHRVMLPEDARDIKFDHKVHTDIYKFLDENDPKMIFIYGENDPWTAPAPQTKLFQGKDNMFMVVQPGGSHRARIGNQPEENKAFVWAKLKEWLAQ